MRHILLNSEIDFDGWRHAARALSLHDVLPDEVMWQVKGAERELFGSSPLAVATNQTFNVPAHFVEIAKSAVLHRDPERFALLYRVLFRLRRDHDLLENEIDPDVARVQKLARDVRRDQHKMHAFVRFREFGKGKDARFVAWFEPDHHIVEATAPFFESRFADYPWSILTPERCAHWDGHKTVFADGATKADAASSDPLEDTWRTYYSSIFNPARLKIRAMQAEMPKKYWRNLPEASLIDPLVERARQITRTMIEAAPSAPRPAKQKRVAMATAVHVHRENLASLREEAANCRACHLWKDATQTVFGEGPPHAPIMLVGEQPGDKEDLAGEPFVGPAGRMLDRALADAGIARDKVYVTNAVKHFKFVPRGKIRLHQKPNTAEIKACRPWYERERALIKPALVVAMGATAAQSVFGKTTPIGKNRGHLIDLDDETKALVTVHPSYLLRLPDADAKAREYENFVRDLKIASTFLHKTHRAA
ncbi:MAG: UdgX family uracil-DNA binding protein [Afipia sp.]